MVGTGISWNSLNALKSDFAAMRRQCSCFDQMCTVRAWKVGLLCQVFYLPIIAFAIAKLLFVESQDKCSRVEELSRLGLFMLGTAPGNTGSIYLAALWEGDLELSVALVLISTLLSPFTYFFWWNTLGLLLNNEYGAAGLAIPIWRIVEFLCIMILPIFVGMYIGGKFPSVKKLMDQVRNPVIVLGMLGMVAIFYFQYRHFFQVVLLNHIIASALLAFLSATLAGFSAYLCKLNKAEITSIVIDSCLQNATLSYAVVSGALNMPSMLYAVIPSNAQVLFTTAPIVAVWLAMQADRKLRACLPKRKRVAGIVELNPEMQVYVERKDEVPMLRVGNIKEAWTNQGSGVSNVLLVL